MTQTPGDMLNQIEAALQRWTEDITVAQASIGKHLNAARERVQTAAEEVADSLATLPQGEALRDVVNGLAETLVDWKQAAAESCDWGNRVEQAVALLRGDVAGLSAALAERLHPGSTADASDFQNELAGIHDRVEQLGAEVTEVKAAMNRQMEMQRRLDALTQAVRLQQQVLERLSATVRSFPAEKDTQGAVPESQPPVQAPDAFDLEEVLKTDGRPAMAGIGHLEAYDVNGSRRRMGEILVSAGLITSEQLEAALAVQEQDPYRRIGAILVDQGLATEEVVARTLACQSAMEFVDLDQISPDPEAVRAISERLANHHCCIPIRATSDEIVVAMANPLDLIALEDVELASGKRVEPLVSTPSAISRAITRHFGGGRA